MLSHWYESVVALCKNDDCLDESELLSQLEAILKENPNVARETDEDINTLLHWAAMHRSPAFCKLLIDVNPDLVKIADSYNMLPFHDACLQCNVETAKYLFHLYPDCVFCVLITLIKMEKKSWKGLSCCYSLIMTEGKSLL